MILASILNHELWCDCAPAWDSSTIDDHGMPTVHGKAWFWQRPVRCNKLLILLKVVVGVWKVVPVRFDTKEPPVECHVVSEPVTNVTVVLWLRRHQVGTKQCVPPVVSRRQSRIEIVLPVIPWQPLLLNILKWLAQVSVQEKIRIRHTKVFFRTRHIHKADSNCRYMIMTITTILMKVTTLKKKMTVMMIYRWFNWRRHRPRVPRLLDTHP